MSKRTVTNESVERTLRALICPVCYQRPEGTDKLGPTIPRACEPTCPIFLNVPKLRAIAQRCADAPTGAHETEVKNLICQKCQLSATSGDFCAEYEHRTCPLSRYVGEVIAAIDTLREWEKRSPESCSI